ncbi:MAG: endonuclease [Elusimicrobia bacterium]|nr:endonuclease [Elusimicrobiota bacterium]
MNKRWAAALILAGGLRAAAFGQTVVQPVPVAPAQVPVILQTNLLQSVNLSASALNSPLAAAKAVDLSLPTALPSVVAVALREAPSPEGNVLPSLKGAPAAQAKIAAQDAGAVRAVNVQADALEAGPVAFAAASLKAQADSPRIIVPDVSKGLHQAIREYAKPEQGAEAAAAYSKSAVLFDGAKVRDQSRDQPAVDAVKAAVQQPKTDYLREAQGQSGRDLLGTLHRLVSRSHHERGYDEARQYMYRTADNQVLHGVRGIVDAYSGIFLVGDSGDGTRYKERGDENGDGYVDRDGVNAEHVWPQSFFNRASPMRSDLHNLMATLMHPNSVRGHLPFGEVDSSRPEYSNKSGAKMSDGVFEPPDFSKGRVARAALYFYTRYCDRNIFQGESRRFFKERIELFLRWNREHPPTEFERRRNDLVEQWQGNRNPFVDNPELAERIGIEGFRSLGPKVASQTAAPAPNRIVSNLREEDLKRDFAKVQPGMPVEKILRKEHGKRWLKRRHGSSARQLSTLTSARFCHIIAVNALDC